MKGSGFPQIFNIQDLFVLGMNERDVTCGVGRQDLRVAMQEEPRSLMTAWLWVGRIAVAAGGEAVPPRDSSVSRPRIV